MHSVLNAPPKLMFACGALLAIWMAAPMAIGAAPLEPQAQSAEPVRAEFRGCESSGWCRFWIEVLDPFAHSLYRVYPDGIPRSFDDEAVAVAMRDRLNALLASMVHQHKRIVLHDLREVGDGMFAAMVTVNEADLASDRIVLELRRKFTGTTR
jgi:hypothetical protein